MIYRVPVLVARILDFTQELGHIASSCDESSARGRAVTESPDCTQDTFQSLERLATLWPVQ